MIAACGILFSIPWSVRCSYIVLYVSRLRAAGGAAHLPGMLAANTTLPILGVPVPTEHLGGQDSLYSIVQMPKGVPVATFAIGKAGAINAALCAVSILALNDNALAQQLSEFREAQRDIG